MITPWAASMPICPRCDCDRLVADGMEVEEFVGAGTVVVVGGSETIECVHRGGSGSARFIPVIIIAVIMHLLPARLILTVRGFATLDGLCTQRRSWRWADGSKGS
jgi:hypothetical protein